MKVSATVPSRIDLAGGTLDVYPLYLFEHGGLTVNAAINVHGHVTVEARADARIYIRSEDTGAEETLTDLDEMQKQMGGGFDLVRKALRFYRPRRGLNVTLRSEAPRGSGLGASSALLMALSSALNEIENLGLSKDRLIDLGANIEAQVIGIPTGKQDYFPPLFGGVCSIWFDVDGHRLERLAMSPGWNTYTWEVPGQFLRPGLNDLRLEFDRLDAPADVLAGNGAIGGTGLQTPVAIEVNSGGPADFAFITIGTGDEAEEGSIHRPGYNVAVIHPKTGRVLDQQGFDTTPDGSESEAVALADFITSVPEGRIVVVALQGDGAAHLTDGAVATFHAIGGQADPQGTTGWSHAIIGVKGAVPGTALEVAGLESGWLRVAPDRRTLGIAVDTLRWEQIDR